jgi:hypothetical protein
MVSVGVGVSGYLSRECSGGARSALGGSVGVGVGCAHPLQVQIELVVFGTGGY